eukprot:4878522-Ditylum_brightwellii.AAC.1
MNCVVADKSEEKYTNKNITLLLQFYNNNKLWGDLLKDKLVGKPHAVAWDDAKTKRRPTSRHICKTWLKNVVQ